MKKTIDQIRMIGEEMIKLAEMLENQTLAETKTTTPKETEAPADPPAPLPKLEDVRAVLADLSRQGHTKEMKELLGRFGAEKLSAVKPEDYPALLAAAKEIKDA